MNMFALHGKSKRLEFYKQSTILSTMLIFLLIVWGVVGGLFAADGTMGSIEDVNGKQALFLIFLHGPIIWAIFAVVCVIGGIVWIYEWLGKW